MERVEELLTRVEQLATKAKHVAKGLRKEHPKGSASGVVFQCAADLETCIEVIADLLGTIDTELDSNDD